MKKKQITILILTFIIIFISKAKADEFWPYTLVTCIPEIDYFSAEGIRIHSGSDKDSDYMRKNGKLIKKKNNMIKYDDTEIYKCKLNNANIKIQVEYWRPMAENASLKLWLNNNLIIDLKYFNTDDFCTIDRCPTINKIIYKHYNQYYKLERIFMEGKDRYYRKNDTQYYEDSFDYKDSNYDKVITNKLLDKVMFNTEKEKD
jgi:hypothetical protein